MSSYCILPKTSWGEALQIANHLQKRSLTKAITTNRSPFETWHVRPPNLSYLKFLG